MSSKNPLESFTCSIDVSPTMNNAKVPLEKEADLASIRESLHDIRIGMRELIHIARDHLDLARRNEERFQRQMQAQREDFERWLGEHPDIGANCDSSQETIRRLLGQSIADLVQHIDTQGEGLLESDYARSEMIDRYGSLLGHLSAMHAMLRRISAVDQSNEPPRPET